VSQPSIRQFFPLETAREKQLVALDFIQKSVEDGYRDIVICAPTGCHPGNQKVVMYDGTLKKAIDVCVGDTLMGPDSNPRKVMRLIKGAGKLYRVKPTKGSSFVVNEDHILALELTPNHDYISINREFPISFKCAKKSAISQASKYTVSVRDYVKSSKSIKHLSKLYHSEEVIFSQPCELLSIPPRILGLWLGDGVSSLPILCNTNLEILNEWKDWGASIGMAYQVIIENEKAVGMSLISTRPRTRGCNTAKELLIKEALLNNKHIPYKYLVASVNNRKALLSGLIDTDGSHLTGTFFYSTTLKKLADQVAFLGRSLGMLCLIKTRVCTCQTGARVRAYLVSLMSNNPESIPTRIKHKKSPLRNQKKNVLRTGLKVIKAGHGRYYGWTLSGDGLYLLEDFTVTHNCGKTFINSSVCLWGASANLPGDPGGYMLVAQKMLQDQIEHDFPRYRPNFQVGASLKSASEYTCPLFKSCSLGTSKHKKKKACPLGDRCAYRMARSAFVNSPLAVTNYPYFLTERMHVGKLPSRRVVVCDEVQGLEKQLLRHVDLIVSEASLPDWAPTLEGVPDTVCDLASYASWIRDSYLPVVSTRSEALSELAEGNGADKLIKEAFKLDQHVSKVTTALELIAQDPDDWIFWISEDSNGQKEYTARPLNAAPFMPLITKMGAVRLYTSAYPGSKSIFCRSLGLNPNRVAWCSLRSTFPVENRPVVIGSVGSMSRRNLESSLPVFMSTLEKIFKRHVSEKGLIHCASYALGKMISERLRGTEHGSRLIFPTKADERDSAFKQHCESPFPTVLLTPSMSEGFDFAGDLARWQVIAKVPYPSLGDRHVVAKKDQDNDWYALETVKSIIQSAGRIVRSDTDVGVTYVLDSDFNRLHEQYSSYFPKWFTDAFVYPKR
jgi:hypothetical protein